MFSSDLPIKTANEDMLNRQSFSKNLAKVMFEYSAPEAFAIGLYGKWGSGKTSVINMVLEQIDVLSKNTKEKTIILKFNPWLCSDPKQLIYQFFKQLSSAIKIKQPKLSTICNFIDNYADAFDLVGTIPVAGNILSPLTKILQKKAKAYKRSRDLQDIKNNIISTLLKEKLKIIVTIDDVDRLSNDEIISVFKLVRSLADFPYTIYLLAFDHEVVVRALGEVQKGNGAEYLEKVIQVPFELPIPNATDIYQVFFNKLDTIISGVNNEKWDEYLWAEVFHFGIKQYIHSIRDVIRYTNVFALKYALLKDETDVIDLIALTCIQVFEPNAYSKLPFYKEQLCGTISLYSGERHNENEKIQQAYNAIISDVDERNKEAIKNLLNILFPKLKSNHWFRSGRYYDNKKFFICGNISNPSCFDRYFALALEPEAIPTSTINYLLYKSSEQELMDGIKKVNSEHKINRFIDHVQATFEANKEKKEFSERALLVLKCLIRSWDYLYDDDNNEFFSLPFSWRLIFCSEALLELIDQEKRFTVISCLFNDAQVSLSTFLVLLQHFEKQHNRFTDKDKCNNEKQLLTLAEVCNLEKLFIERTVEELDTGILINHNDALNIIWLFEKIDPSLAQEKIKNIVKDNLSLAKLIRAATSHGKAASRTVYKIWTVSKENISKYINIKEAYERMISFSITKEFSELPHDLQKDVSAFLISMELPEDNDNTFNDSIVSSDIEKRLKQLDSKNRHACSESP